MMIGIAPSTGGEALKIAIGGLIALTIIGYVASPNIACPTRSL